MKPCRHELPNPTCRLCWLFDHDARYRAMWGGDPATVTPSTSQAPTPPILTPEKRAELDKIKGVITRSCRHLGGELETRSSCGCGKSSLRHSCAILGECRVYAPRATDSLPQCSTCPHYEAPNV